VGNTGSRLAVWILNICVGLALVVIIPLFSSSYILSLATQVLVFAIFAMSLDLLMGYTGLPSFGHAAPFGAAAYVTGILVTRGFQNPWLTILAGILMAAIVSAVFGFFAVRSAEAYFLMITMALGQIIFAIAWNWRRLTGGDDGLPGIYRPNLGLPWPMTDAKYFYLFVLLFFTISYFLMKRYTNSPFGHSLVGIRDNEPRMRALGYNTFLHKYVCFIVAGVFAGVAGVLYAYFNGFVCPVDAGIPNSGECMLMVILGGAGTLFGPALGSAVIVLLKHFVSIYTEHWPLIVGIAFVVTIIYTPRGVSGYLLPLWKKRILRLWKR
jgi:branched-chain amino acid transport system permease protein